MLFAALKLSNAYMINAKNKDGKTPLAYLCSSTREYKWSTGEVVEEKLLMLKLFAGKKADFLTIDKHGYILFHHASGHDDNFGLIHFLLKQGVDLSALVRRQQHIRQKLVFLLRD